MTLPRLVRHWWLAGVGVLCLGELLSTAALRNARPVAVVDQLVQIALDIICVLLCACFASSVPMLYRAGPLLLVPRRLLLFSSWRFSASIRQALFLLQHA